MTTALMLLLGIVLTAGTFVFVSAEFSLVAVDQAVLEKMAEKGDRGRPGWRRFSGSGVPPGKIPVISRWRTCGARRSGFPARRKARMRRPCVWTWRTLWLMGRKGTACARTFWRG